MGGVHVDEAFSGARDEFVVVWLIAQPAAICNFFSVVVVAEGGLARAIPQIKELDFSLAIGCEDLLIPAFQGGYRRGVSFQSDSRVAVFPHAVHLEEEDVGVLPLAQQHVGL